ncbi:hypothetical protein D9619_000472 [Psilocybe cf. subviscida]|uniref:RCC1-like domain-containing protein n=1 Tax=Psilocybe cf. subviscida TaxID=2480587 RepID=A0A8H5BF38_9AGAR|nr:hypothetical protein D9619_000472 [Psilocybe cf. subviscida]
MSKCEQARRVRAKGPFFKHMPTTRVTCAIFRGCAQAAPSSTDAPCSPTTAMPPRRSSRASSANPAPAAEAKADPPKSKVNGVSKRRAASPERAPAPAAKRSRPASQSENEPPAPQPTKKSRSKAPTSKSAAEPALEPVPEDAEPAPPKKAKTPKPAPTREPTAEHIQTKPYFNPLPTPPNKQRPALIPFVWGAGNFGQFGLGPDQLDEKTKPKRNTWAEEQIEDNLLGDDHGGFESVAAGGLHTLFVDEKGAIWSCGVNDDAALGRVTQDVPDPKNPGQFLSIDELTSWPHPIQSLVTEGYRAVQVVAGDSICAAVDIKGDMRVWGHFRVNEGSLGFSDGKKHQFEPVPILPLPHKPGDAEKVSSIASGSNHLVVLTTHGNIYTWGAGEQSQLGRKVLERRKIHGTHPEKVVLGSRSRKATLVGAGSFGSYAVDDKGDVWAWGLNSMGQTGTGWSTPDDSIVQLPQKVLNISKKELGDDDVVVQIAGGMHHTLFLTKKGRVYAVGRSNAGQLGLPKDHEAFVDPVDPDFVAEPVLVPFPDETDPIAHISCGVHNNAAVTVGGALYAWGQGVQGELGLGDEEEVLTPHVVVRKDGGAWFASAVSCGGQHTIGLFRKKN